MNRGVCSELKCAVNRSVKRVNTPKAWASTPKALASSSPGLLQPWEHNKQGVLTLKGFLSSRTLSGLITSLISYPGFCATLEPWAEISQRLRRMVFSSYGARLWPQRRPVPRVQQASERACRNPRAATAGDLRFGYTRSERSREFCRRDREVDHEPDG